MPKRSGRCHPVLLLILACLIGPTGCGTDVNELLYQTASASSQSFLDLLLVDLANALADSLDQEGTAPSGNQSDGGENPPPPPPPPGDLTGDAASGEEIFASNGCAACHCADAAGGCALSAPSLIGSSADTLDNWLRGDAAHPGGKFPLSDQDIVDLEAFLASLGSGSQ